MPNINICDATGLPIPEGTEHVIGWGKRRVYSTEGLEAVREYEAELKKATVEARRIFDSMHDLARLHFFSKFPEGKLPDDPHEAEDVD